jgi:hypothetical protein
MFYIHGYTLKTKYRNLVIFTNFSSLLGKESLQTHFIFEFLSFLFHFLAKFRKQKKKAVPCMTGFVNSVIYIYK